MYAILHFVCAMYAILMYASAQHVCAIRCAIGFFFRTPPEYVRGEFATYSVHQSQAGYIPLIIIHIVIIEDLPVKIICAN